MMTPHEKEVAQNKQLRKSVKRLGMLQKLKSRPVYHGRGKADAQKDNEFLEYLRVNSLQFGLEIQKNIRESM